MSPLRFGVSVSTSAAPGSDPVAAARRAEELGFDFISATDHPAGEQPSNETWTMLSWIAASTDRIQVACKVLGVPFRPPAITAKMAETLARLSGGRLILGLGGGGSDEEIGALGLPAMTPREKVDGLEDAVRIIRGLWSEPRFDYQGAIYRVNGAQMEPKPNTSTPIWLGTFGKRALTVTGRVGDGWIPSFALAPPEAVPAMRERILRAARQAKRPPEAITCVYSMEIQIGPGPAGRSDIVAGTPDAIIERLASFVDLGFSAMNFSVVGPGEDEQLEQLATEVLPSLREIRTAR
jgi:alkanesulfonate monooxygenase SsuD/methylene tetrahydromethanopterin reductase-like flavin-dependent oxidoreductase (luciferase family)